MDFDVVVVGGGLGGSGLAMALARKGKRVLVLEREAKFKDRVRGENMHPWGVLAAKRLGLLDALMAAGAHRAPFFNIYVMGQQVQARPVPETTPHRESAISMYHPDLQETVLAAAVKAGAEVKRGAVVQSIADANGGRSVTYTENGQARTTTARLVVGADGRFSRMREWGGFTETRDPNLLRIGGVLVENASIPEAGVHFAFGEGFASFLAPLGKGRARLYFIYPGVTGDRKHSGKEKVPEFLDAVRATMIPASWLAGVTPNGPLAEFEGADHWVPSPAKNGVALIGDAAGATDPSWGSGLAKTMLDVEHLSDRLTETDDWDAALAAYAREHDDYFGKLHDILGWLTQLYWTPGPAADERRFRVMISIKQDPTGFPDPVGLGPLGPCDEVAKKKMLGLD